MAAVAFLNSVVRSVWLERAGRMSDTSPFKLGSSSQHGHIVYVALGLQEQKDLAEQKEWGQSVAFFGMSGPVWLSHYSIFSLIWT